MGKAKPRVRAVASEKVADKPATSTTRSKGKMPKTLDCGVGPDSEAAAAKTNRQTVDSTVAAMKKLETRTTALCNTPVKIPSPGDVALSQAEPVFEVGWDCHSPCDEGAVNTCNVVEIMRTFAHEEHDTHTVHPSGTPPLLGLWIGSAFEDDPNPASRRLQNHSRFRKCRNMRPTGIKRAADSRALFQRLATVLESHADTPELSPRRSARLIQQSHSKKTAENDCPLKIAKNSESEKCHFRSASAQHAHKDPVINLPKPQLNRSSEDDLWTDEELFDNDSFIKATQDLFTREGFLSPKSVKVPMQTSTPMEPSKVGRYTFSLESPPLLGIASRSQFKHGTLVSSVEKVVKAVHRDQKAKVKVVAAVSKTLPFRNYHDEGATSSLAAGGTKPHPSEQCWQDTAPTLQGLHSRTSAGLHHFKPSTLQIVKPLGKCQSSVAAQTFPTHSKSAQRPANFLTGLTRVTQPSLMQLGQNVHRSTGNVKNINTVRNDHQPSGRLLPQCTAEQTSIVQNTNITDNSISDDLLAELAEPDELLDSQECLNGGIPASQSSTVILSGGSHGRCVMAREECQSNCSVTKCPDPQSTCPAQAENSFFTSDDDAFSEPQLLAMLAELESTQALEEKFTATASKEAVVNQIKPCQETKLNVQRSRSVPKPAGRVYREMSHEVGASVGGTCASRNNEMSSTQKRCSPEEIERKKEAALQRRKKRLGLCGIKR